MTTNSTPKSQNQENSSKITLETVRNRTQQTVRDAFEVEDDVLIEALPATGKTSSIPLVVNQTDIAVTYLTSRQDLYADMKDACKEEGCNWKVLPRFHEDCPTANGGHGEAAAERVKSLYSAGISPSRLHDELNLPCEPNCPYREDWDFDPEEHDILIGHYTQAYVTQVIQGRIVVLDEFPGESYISTFENPVPIISEYVARTNEIPYDSYDDIIQNREMDDEMGWEVFELVNDRELHFEKEVDIENHSTEAQHILAPTLTLALIGVVDLGNGFETTKTTGWEPVSSTFTDRTVAREKETGKMWVLNPPDFSYAEGVIGLDGTPTPSLWDIACGLKFTHRAIMDKSEKGKYIRDVLNAEIFQINRNRKPYQNPRNVTPPKDTKLLFWIWLREDEKPGLITSKKALGEYSQYNNGETLDYISAFKNFAQIRSSNDFEDKQLGAVFGSRHYGDVYIKRWGAFAGEAVESNNERGEDRDYGKFGNQVLQQLELETLQDVLRFGRNPQSTRVYVNTSVLPDWVPTEIPERWTKFSEGSREIITSLQARERDALSVAGVRDKTGLSDRRVRDILDEFTKDGYIEKHPHLGPEGAHLYEWDGFKTEVC